MSIERTSLVIDPQAPIDEPWNSEFRAIVEDVPEVFEQLRPDAETLAAEKALFFALGRTSNPDLGPRDVDLDRVRFQETVLLDFKADVLSDPSVPPGVQQLYRWRVNDAVANNRILQAAATGDMTSFGAYNRFIYGTPDRTLAAAAADWFRTGAQEAMADTDVSAVHEAGEALLEAVPDMGGDRTLLIPDAETFAAVRENHMRAGGYYALLFAGVTLPEKGPVKPDVGEPILRQVRRNLDAGHYEIVDADGSVWSASHHPTEMRRPAQYKMPLLRFMGLPGHEWEHILERINGDRQPLRLTGIGLDRYENGNEGRAVMREQVVYPTFGAFTKQLRFTDIARRHLAVSLAEGVDTGAQRNFAATFGIMNAIDRFHERNKKPDDIEAADAKADTRSWDLGVRVMRGTNGEGGAYLKDMVYLAGNVACWTAARDNPDIVDLGDLGKFDITNQRHLSALRELGVLPPVR